MSGHESLDNSPSPPVCNVAEPLESAVRSQVEGLHQVVVRAAIKPRNAIGDGVASSHDQDRFDKSFR